MADGDLTKTVTDQEIRRLSSIAALVMLVAGAVIAAIGVGWWIHPGAGLAVLGVCTFIIGIFIGRE